MNSFAPAPKAGRVESIQWLRGIAAMLVVLYHACDMALRRGDTLLPGLASNLLGFGNSGVDLFFVISGFVMAHSLGQTTSARAFLISRWQRIWPLFVLASAIFIALFGSADILKVSRLAPSLLILPLTETTGYHQPALPVGWTLGFEAMFYLMVAAVIGRRGGAVMLLALTAAAASLGLFVTLPWAPARMLANPLVFEFALGIGVWLIWSRGRGEAWRPALFAVGIMLLAAGIAGVGLTFVPANPLLVVANDHVLNRTLMWGCPWALVVLGLLGDTGIAGVAAKGLGALGDASYSIYLFHFVILELVRRAIPLPAHDVLAFMAVGTSLSLIGGLAVYRWVERPLLRALRRVRPAAAPSLQSTAALG